MSLFGVSTIFIKKSKQSLLVSNARGLNKRRFWTRLLTPKNPLYDKLHEKQFTIFTSCLLLFGFRSRNPLRVQKRLNTWKCHKNQFDTGPIWGHLSPFLPKIWFFLDRALIVLRHRLLIKKKINQLISLWLILMVFGRW